MAPKKNIRNAFYFFMIEVRQREEAKGRRFSGLNEVSQFASPLWNNMSVEDKEPYNRLAAQAKKGSNGEDGRNKFTSLGVSFAEVDAEARELEEYQSIMLQYIRSTVRCLDIETTLRTHSFFLCHVNYFYKTENNFYSVAEIALSEFNLGRGLLGTIHFFVDPGQLMKGYRFEAKDWAEKTHAIPYDWKGGEKDYYKIYMTIHKFLTKDNPASIPPVYTMPDCLNSNMSLSAVKSVFLTLCEATNTNSSHYRVYPLPELFYEIRNKCANSNDRSSNTLVPSVAIILNEIEKDVFSYAKDLGCTYHEELDRTVHCSLSIVTRWVFTICDHCCKHLGISLERGKHCPKDADIDWDYKFARMEEEENAGNRKPDKNKNPVMPTIIDHGKLKEIRELQYIEEKENAKRNEIIRPPKMNPMMPGRPGGSGIGRGSGSSQNNEQPAWPVSGRGRMFLNN